uniref:Uncharacterized protein n=1 Tax=Rhizophora mucronata TaxID=61149 RepID=A0A2P2L9Q1_RHIMU
MISFFGCTSQYGKWIKAIYNTSITFFSPDQMVS